jgi:hypothetical protein
MEYSEEEEEDRQIYFLREPKRLSKKMERVKISAGSLRDTL